MSLFNSASVDEEGEKKIPEQLTKIAIYKLLQRKAKEYLNENIV